MNNAKIHFVINTAFIVFNSVKIQCRQFLHQQKIATNTKSAFRPLLFAGSQMRT